MRSECLHQKHAVGLRTKFDKILPRARYFLRVLKVVTMKSQNWRRYRIVMYVLLQVQVNDILYCPRPKSTESTDSREVCKLI